jgi:hypothetical protein
MSQNYTLETGYEGSISKVSLVVTQNDNPTPTVGVWVNNTGGTDGEVQWFQNEGAPNSLGGSFPYDPALGLHSIRIRVVAHSVGFLNDNDFEGTFTITRSNPPSTPPPPPGCPPTCPPPTATLTAFVGATDITSPNPGVNQSDNFSVQWSTTNATSATLYWGGGISEPQGSAGVGVNSASGFTCGSGTAQFQLTVNGPGGTVNKIIQVSCAPYIATGGPPCPGDCAQFIAQNVPSEVPPGQPFSVSVTMKNIGTTTWNAPYRLGCQNLQDNNTWGICRVQVPSDIQPGQNATFNFSVVAPNDLGLHNFQWQMVHEGVTWFGDMTPNVSINVTASAPIGGNGGGSSGGSNGSVATPASAGIYCQPNNDRNGTFYHGCTVPSIYTPFLLVAKISPAAPMYILYNDGFGASDYICTDNWFPGDCTGDTGVDGWNAFSTTIGPGHHDALTYQAVPALGGSSDSIVVSVVPAVPAVTAPTNLAVSNAVACRQLQLNWTAAANEQGYYINRGTSPGTEVQIANLTDPAATSYLDNDPGLLANTRYYYTVTAYRISDGAAVTSNEANAFNRPCIADLSNSSKAIVLAGTKAYSPTVIIQNGDILTFLITIRNESSASAANINYVCDNLSSVFDRSFGNNGIRNVVYSQNSFWASPIDTDTSNCGGGTKFVPAGAGLLNPGTSTTITFESKINSTSRAEFDQLSNSARINYSDSSGNCPCNKTVTVGSILFSTGRVNPPDFREVAP